jgi:CHAT domain
VADAWRRGDEQGRLAGLAAVSASLDGQFLLTTPSADQVSQTLLATAMDAVVYLVPPAPPDAFGAPGRALLVRPGYHVDVLELPGVAVGPGTPLGDYLAAFVAALDTHEPRQRNPGGFRGTLPGRAWADALTDLGSWAHTHIVGPLVEHTRGWPLDRTPHVALVPLGELAAIPYAAAWVADPAVPGGRRYAIHDLVLTHTVSARLLTDVARRPRLPLTERVVLVNDPTGEFPYSRAIAKALARQLYPGAEVYGRGKGKELTGPATTSALLAALPGDEGPGASLLHLSTHATTRPTAQLQAVDGWLPLAHILERARDRPPHAAGGLVVTNACLTDSTNAHYDESVTLATALLAAGATGVIGTRWPIDDDTTATLAHYLHHHLAGGHLPAHALRLAQLDLLDPAPRTLTGLHSHLAALPPSRLAHPASWAGYVHHGR